MSFFNYDAKYNKLYKLKCDLSESGNNRLLLGKVEKELSRYHQQFSENITSEHNLSMSTLDLPYNSCDLTEEIFYDPDIILSMRGQKKYPRPPIVDSPSNSPTEVYGFGESAYLNEPTESECPTELSKSINPIRSIEPIGSTGSTGSTGPIETYGCFDDYDTDESECQCYQSPVGSCEHEQSPTGSCEHEQSPTGSCEHQQSPTGSCEHEQSPTGSCEHQQSPTGPCEDEQIITETCEDYKSCVGTTGTSHECEIIVGTTGSTENCEENYEENCEDPSESCHGHDIIVECPEDPETCDDHVSDSTCDYYKQHHVDCCPENEPECDPCDTCSIIHQEENCETCHNPPPCSCYD